MRHKRTRVTLFLAVALAALVALSAACGSKKAATTTPTATATATTTGGLPADAAPADQQIFRVNNQAEANTVDPNAASYTYEINLARELYIGLFNQDPKTGALVPWAASQVPTQANGGIAADGVTYTVKLKPGLKWSDGSPVTAQDFVYGILRGYDSNVSGSGYYGFITTIKGSDCAYKLKADSPTYTQDIANCFKDSVVAVDQSTLKLVSSGASASFLYNFTLPITFAVPKANVEQLGKGFGQATAATQMVVDGPFKVKEWVAKDHVTLVPNPSYTAGSKPYLQQVVLRFIEDANQSYNAYQSGQLDATNFPAALYPTIQKDATLSAQIQQEDEFGVRWISVDKTIAPWNNAEFVLAVNQATDRSAIAKDVFFGLRKAWASPCNASVVDCQPDIFDKAYGYNLDSAKAHLAKAYPNGNPPTVTLNIINDPTIKSFGATLQQQWKAIGVNVDVKVVDQKTARADFKAHKSGMQITGWGMDYADPTDLWTVWVTGGGNNLGSYSNKQYDALAAKQDATLDPAARKQVLTQLQQLLASDPPVIPFAVVLTTQLFKPYVKGIVHSPFDAIFIGDQNLEKIYIAKH